MKILILGGYGVFGGRLAELLSDNPDLKLMISGRNLDRAVAFCAAYEGVATTSPLELDRNDIAIWLRTGRPDLVVDASGPFQNYGDDPYRVVKACISAGVDYLDFADGAGFVFGVSQFDADAKTAGVFVLSGVSSFPVLPAAVLRNMAERMEIVSVTGGIAPTPYAGIGLNVMRAVVGCAGAPVKLLRDGQQTTAIGLAESMRFTIAPLGRLPLRNIHFSLVDVPDLQVLPPEHPAMRDIWMGAGPVPEILHRALNILAKARGALGLPSLVRFSRLFYLVLNLMKFGEHRGGMFIHAKGLKDGAPVEESWHLLAEGDDGPYIPSMAIEALVRKLLKGARPANGAGPAIRSLELEDYEALFESRSIQTGFRQAVEPATPLYRVALGSAFETLPKQLQHLHDATAPHRWSGIAEVQRGKGLLAHLIGKIIGFPPAAKQVPVQVDLVPVPEGERWTRDFGGRIFSSFQSLGTGKNEHLVVEQFGVVSVALALVVEGDHLYIVPRRWSCLGIPLPGIFLPSGSSFETERAGKFCFDVEIRAPLIGLIVRYNGVLVPVEVTKPSGGSAD